MPVSLGSLSRLSLHARPQTHAQHEPGSGTYDQASLRDYARVLGPNALNSASLGFIDYRDKALDARYPTAALVGNVVGNVPLAAATGGWSLPAQAGIGAGANMIQAYNEGAGREGMALSGLLGASAPLVGRGLGEAARRGFGAVRGASAGLLGASRGMGPEQLANVQGAAEAIQNHATYQELRTLGQRALGLQDAIANEADPLAAARLRQSLDQLKQRFDYLQSTTSMAPDEAEAGVRQYLANEAARSPGALGGDLTGGGSSRNYSSGLRSALNSGVANTYAAGRGVSLTPNNVSLLASKTELSNPLGLIPESRLPEGARNALSSLASPGMGAKAEFIRSYMNANADRYAGNAAVGNKVLFQEANSAWEAQQAKNALRQQLLGNLGQTLGSSSRFTAE